MLWSRIDVQALVLRSWPEAVDPRVALDTWRGLLAADFDFPRMLFPVCLTSWVFLFIELNGPDDHRGGSLYGWQYGGSDFLRVFEDLADWLDTQTRAIAAGRIDPQTHRILASPDALERAAARPRQSPRTAQPRP